MTDSKRGLRLPLVPPPAPSSSRPQSPPRTGPCVIVDRDPPWASAADSLSSVSIVAPGDGALDRIAELAPDRVVANFATDGAFEVLETLRATGSAAWFFGYLALPGTGRALSLGRV